MHTSETLRSPHFRYWRMDAGGRARAGFNSFCADYHEQDRVGVVSPRLEDGVLGAGYALLALTTAFYDAQRARAADVAANGGQGDFFIYPQHFAIIGADKVGVATGAGRLNLSLDEAGIGGAWAWLDVWPASNWLTAPPAAVAMLQTVFNFQINRLFWPQDFKAAPPKRNPAIDPLPDYARKLLKARLKSVYYYNTSAPTVAISAAQPAADIVQASIGRLPTAVQRTLPADQVQPAGADPGADGYPYREQYRQVSVDDFLQEMDACFH